jgi:Flp pilus assembly protein TadG
MGKHFRGKAGKHRGQALVEFALAFTIFLLVLLGIIEFGRLLVAFSSVYTAAREAARYGSALETAQDCSGIRAAAARVGALGGVQGNSTDVQIYFDKPDEPVTNSAYGGPTLSALSCPKFDSTSYPTCPCTVPLGSRINVTVQTQFSFIVLSLPALNLNSSSSRSVIKSVELYPQVITPPSP